MPDIELAPGDYRVKGAPILTDRWWVGALTIAFIFLFAMFVMRPLYGAWSDFFDAYLSWRQ